MRAPAPQIASRPEAGAAHSWPAEEPEAHRRFGSTGLHRKPHAKQWLLLAAAIALATAASAALSSIPLFHLLELKIYDLGFVLNGPTNSSPNIILVAIDSRTEAAIPDPRIFWQPYFATLLHAAAEGGARAIGLDVSFGLPVEKWAPDYDRQLAAAYAEVSATVPVVLSYDNLQSTASELPIYLLASAQNGMGFANFTLDPDNFVRRQELVSRDRQAWESLAARLAAVALGKQWSRTESSSGITLRLGETPVPVDASGFLPIHFSGPPGSFPQVSMIDVLEAAKRNDSGALERWFKGKVALIGTMDPSDRQPTPFYLWGNQQQLMAGVEIQAHILSTLLDGRFLRDAPRLLVLLLAIVGAVLAALACYYIRYPLGPVLLVALILAGLTSTILAQRAGVILPAVPSMLAMSLAGLSAYGINSLTEGKQRRLLQKAFGSFVSDEIARDVLQSGVVSLIGTRQVVTVMFSDLRNYTSYCQGRDPHEVVAELNQYFADMTAEIKACGGMVNKFIGDGIMALFGAPLPHPDDALRAVRCSLRMIERNEEFNQRRAARGQEPLVIGIALHTGDAVVGNIGAPEKMEYTAIGDTVNVASRIEGENKTYGTRLLVSETTYECVREYVAGELAGEAKLKGVSKPVRLYKIVGLKQE